MKAIKQYGWALKVTGAALILGLAIFLELSSDGTRIVSIFIGFAIVLYSIIRLVPFVKTQKSDLIKTINIIEITIDFAIGLTLILVPLFIDGGFGDSPVFGWLLGTYLLLRGIIHFYSVSSHNEKSDLPLFIFHIAAIVVGTILFWETNFDLFILIHIILVLSVASGGYLGYDGYKGYNSYRHQKTLTMPKVDKPVDSDSDTVEKRIPVTEQEEPVQDQIVN